jgi:hypothetical protein
MKDFLGLDRINWADVAGLKGLLTGATLIN